MAPRLSELTDADWHAIEAAVAPHVASPQAREAVEDCLRDHRGLRSDPAKLRAARERWRLAAKLARDLANTLLEIRPRKPRTVPDPLPHLQAAKFVQRHAETQVKGLDIMARAMQGRRDPAREWFYGRILEIWTQEFGGRLAVTVPIKRGPPTGPLIRFVQAVARHAMEESLNAHTIADAVRRERRRRR